jgi:YD repeat-containing protein
MFTKLARTLGVLAIVALVPAAQAQTANQTVTYAVNAINQIAFVGAPSLTITTAVAGSAPTSVTDASATWAVTCNQTGAKITATLAANMPAGLTLSSNLVAPTGGASAGYLALSTVGVDLVTGITKLAQGALGVTYKLDATAAAGVVASATKVVTYTISGGV